MGPARAVVARKATGRIAVKCIVIKSFRVGVFRNRTGEKVVDELELKYCELVSMN
jgi:hypothetical protein